MVSNLSELLSRFSQVRMATTADNNDILKLIQGLSMKTSEGGLAVDRNPNFFALGHVQGEKSFTFLFENEDGSLGGVGCVSLCKMAIQGEPQYVGYTSDLKFSPQISQVTRKQFYQFYGMLIENFPNIEEFEGCRLVTACILDDNQAAQKVLVSKNKRSQDLQHIPFYQYDNINVLGLLPSVLELSDIDIVSGKRIGRERILEILTTSSDHCITWSRDEILRRQAAVGFSFDDFIVALDKKGEILGLTLVLSDFDYRRLVVDPLPKTLKIANLFTPLLGRPRFTQSQPLHLGYFSFLKINTTNPQKRARILSKMIRLVQDMENLKTREERYHVINIQEPREYKMAQRLLPFGILSKTLKSTLYQVKHSKQPKMLEPNQLKGQRPDFDVVFH